MITLAMVMSLAMPPAKYDPALRPTRRVEVVIVPANMIEAVCPKDHDYEIMLGCYRTGTDKIYRRDDIAKDALPRFFRHEYGHVNGWKHK